jgi:hypothetical protein
VSSHGAGDAFAQVDTALALLDLTAVACGYPNWKHYFRAIAIPLLATWARVGCSVADLGLIHRLLHLPYPPTGTGQNSMSRAISAQAVGDNGAPRGDAGLFCTSSLLARAVSEDAGLLLSALQATVEGGLGEVGEVEGVLEDEDMDHGIARIMDRARTVPPEPLRPMRLFSTKKNVALLLTLTNTW